MYAWIAIAGRSATANNKNRRDKRATAHFPKDWKCGGGEPLSLRVDDTMRAQQSAGAASVSAPSDSCHARSGPVLEGGRALFRNRLTLFGTTFRFDSGTPAHS